MPGREIITYGVFLLLLGFHSLEKLVENGCLSILTGWPHMASPGTYYLLIDF